MTSETRKRKNSMKKELEQALAERFPFMRRGPSIGEQHTACGRVEDLYSAFGLEMDDGWFQLIWDMCGEITAVYAAVGQTPDLVVDQVKEKYGTLRFYWHPREGAVFRELHRQVDDIVDRYEEKSACVCECCGAPGELRDLPWMLTLCDVHYAEEQKRQLAGRQ